MKEAERLDECFVIMPISDVSEYPKGHFRRVYEDIIRVACANAGYRAVRADDVLQTNMIHLDILKRLIDSPMAICDLSTRNPNVLFELGIRQAFDRPVVLIQEEGTPRIFDIAGMRCTEYRRNRIYHEVLEDQESIEAALRATRDAREESINSIVRLLSVEPAAVQEHDKGSPNAMLQVVQAEISELRHVVMRDMERRRNKQVDSRRDVAKIKHLRETIERLEARIGDGPTEESSLAAYRTCEHASMEIERLLRTTMAGDMERRELSHLHRRARRLEAYARGYMTREEPPDPSAG